jgi:ABC-type lipoprotein export system ATPase subunit
MSEPIISARDVRKTYELGRQKLEVLRGVSLEVEKGGFVALRGASGAGKSTLLHLLGGLDTPTNGQVTVCGKSVGSLSASELARFRNKRIGYIFQAYYLLPEFDALENVCIPARMARMNFSEARARATELLHRVGLGNRLDHRPYELSGGEQQRVAIARALINEPEIILADEPTGNLDSHTGESILQVLCELREERQTTLVIATHDEKVAHRAPCVIHLADGVIVNGGV